MSEFQDYYEVLGVDQDSSLPEIRAAYRRVALKYHPDKSSIDPGKAADMFRKLTAASDLLSDSAKRAEYDKIYTARKNAQKRFEALDADAYRKRIELEQREYIASMKVGKINTTAASARLKKILSIREENKARMMEEAKKFDLHLRSILHTAGTSRKNNLDQGFDLKNDITSSGAYTRP